MHTWLPFVLIMSTGVFFGQLTFLIAYTFLVGALCAWFCFYSYILH